MAVVGVLLVACGGDDADRPSAPSGTPAPGVTPVPDLADRLEPAVVAAGDDLFVFGGQRATAPGTYEDKRVHPRDDGALIDLSTGAVEVLAKAPFDRPLINPAAVKVGDVIIVLGDLCIGSRPPEGNANFCEPGTYAAAGYNLKSQAWHEITVPAELRSVKEGRAQVVGSSGDGRAVFELGSTAPQYWAYSPAEDRWTLLRKGSSVHSQACTTHDQLVELSLPTSINGPAATPELTRFDLTRGGTSAPTPVPGATWQPFAIGALVCLDDQVLVLDPMGAPNGTRYFDLAAGTWTPISDAPASLFALGRRVWTGEELVFLPSGATVGAPALAFDPSTSQWRTIANPPPVTNNAVWNGTKIVGYAEPLPTPAGAGKRSQAGVFTFSVARAG